VVDTWMCHSQRRDASIFRSRKQIHVDQSVFLVRPPLVPLLHDCAHCRGTVSASSLSKSAGEHLPQAGEGNFDKSLQTKVLDTRTSISFETLLNFVWKSSRVLASTVINISNTPRIQVDLPAAPLPVTNCPRGFPE
jgi:hypothetical protein